MQRIVSAVVLVFLLAPCILAAKPKIAIIIDDLGYLPMPRAIAALPPEISISVIPFTQFDTAVALAAFSQQRDVLLHLPMQSPLGTPQEPFSLRVDMNKAQLQTVVQEALYRVPQAIAVNNHMGSLFTQQSQPIHWLMALLKSKQLGFIDSRTTSKTVAQQIAQQYGIANNRRHVFLDNVADEAYIQQQLSLAINQAKRNGIAIAIAHPFPLTINTLAKRLPALQQEVELVPISAVLRH